MTCSTRTWRSVRLWAGGVMLPSSVREIRDRCTEPGRPLGAAVPPTPGVHRRTRHGCPARRREALAGRALGAVVVLLVAVDGVVVGGALVGALHGELDP